jgi:hypothetical protein
VLPVHIGGLSICQQCERINRNPKRDRNCFDTCANGQSCCQPYTNRSANSDLDFDSHTDSDPYAEPDSNPDTELYPVTHLYPDSYLHRDFNDHACVLRVAVSGRTRY